MSLVVMLVLLHHSFVAVFDAEAPVTVTGPVTKLEWANPHVFFYIDGKTPAGAPATWAIENASPNTLIRQGFTRNTVKVGDVVTVQGCRARDGSTLVYAQTVTLAEGQKVFGSGAPNCPVKQP